MVVRCVKVVGARQWLRRFFWPIVCCAWITSCAGVGADVRAGREHLSGKRYPDAQAAFSRALTAEPRNLQAKIGLGMASLHQGRFEEADTALTAALELGEGPELWMALGILRQTQRRYTTAIEWYQKTLEAEPQDAEAHYRLGQTFLAVERHAEAADAFQVAVQLEPQLVAAWVQLAEALVGLGRYNDTIATLKDIRTSIHGARGAKINIALGRAYLASKKPIFAARAFEQASRRDPSNTDAIRGLASAMRQEGKFAEAIDVLLKATREHKRDAGLFLELGLTYKEFRLTDQAIAALTTATKLRPTMSEVYPALLDLIGTSSRHKDRVYAILARGAKALPNDIQLQQRFGRAAFDRLDYKTTIAAMMRVIEITPADADANFFLGVAQHRVGKLVEAEASYDALQVVDPARAVQMRKLMSKGGRGAPGKDDLAANDGASVTPGAGAKRVRKQSKQRKSKRKKGKRKRRRRGGR